LASGLFRLSGLVAKLCLALYMGRYLSLSDMGSYGLVFGAVMILTTALGMRFDHVASRDLVRVTPEIALARTRDQTLFYLGNYAVAAVVLAVLWMVDASGVSGLHLFYIFALTITDNYGRVIYVNITSMERPLHASILYFISGGLWCIPVIALGIARPALRTVDVVLLGWLLGNLAFFAATLWVFRRLPWKKSAGISVDLQWIRDGLKVSVPIWLGTMGLSASTYLDRFVVAYFLDLEKVGVVTFYWSFAFAILTLAQAGVLSFVYPRLVALHREGSTAQFAWEAWKAAKSVALSAGCIGIVIGVAVPIMGLLFDKPEYVKYESVLWLIILGAWIRANADTLYQILFARKQDRAIWLGNVLYAAPALASGVFLIWWFGLTGVGYASVLSGVFIFGWRAWHLRRGLAR
jgi:O-antigen/teichoic acid export membrane protein